MPVFNIQVLASKYSMNILIRTKDESRPLIIQVQDVSFHRCFQVFKMCLNSRSKGFFKSPSIK